MQVRDPLLHVRRDMFRICGGLSYGLALLTISCLMADVAQAQPASGDPFAAGEAQRGVTLPSQLRPSPQRSNGVRPASVSEDSGFQNPFTIDEPLAEVRIEGNTTIPNSEIAKYIKVRPGRIVTAKQVKDDVDALVRTRWFANVEPSVRRTDEGTILVFRVLERPIVTKVEYRGNKKIKTKDFDRMTQLKPGSPYDVSANKECARRIEEHYHEKGYVFATVELERGDVRDDPDREVIFVINEGPKVAVTAVKFEGNENFSDGILKLKTRSKTRILWLFGGKYDPTTIADDVEGIRQYYFSLGYFDVQVTPRQEFSADKKHLELHYEINEGVRYKIREIEVVGNNVLGEDEIRSMMKVASGEEYNARHIAKDVDAIKTKYGEQGRLYSRVDAVPRWTEDPGIVDIVYKINEDKVYRVRNIDVHIAGDHPHTKTNLIRNLSPIQPGDLADPKKIYLLKRRLEGSQYFETGGAGPRIETEIVKDTWLVPPSVNVARGQNDSAPAPLMIGHSLLSDSTFDVQSDVRVRSNPAVDARQARPSENRTDNGRIEAARPYFIDVPKVFPEADPDEDAAEDDNSKLAPLTPVFRAQSEEYRGQSQDPLQPPANFGFDNSPQGDPFGRAIRNPDPNDWERLPPPEFIDVDAYLTEARTGRLMFGVGVNSDAGVVGNIVLSEQNFDIGRPPTSWDDVWNGTAWRGGGQKFRIEAMPGSQVSRYLVDWQDPYFMDTNYNLGLSGFYFQRFYRDWTEERLGGRVRVGRQFTQQWSGALALRLENVDVSNPRTPTPPILAESVGSNFLSTVRGSIMHDTRDAAFLPGEGHYLELSVEQAFNEYTYTRLEAEGRQYFTTYQRADGGGRHTITLRGQASWSGDDTPIYERFFAGGFQTFRGFAFRGVSPVEGNVRVGGNWMLLGGAEYMLPVTANEMVKTVAFTDFGTVTDKITLDDFRLSVGAGLRITVPMMGPVPIALDFAYPILKEDFDKRQIFSFYVGINR